MPDIEVKPAGEGPDGQKAYTVVFCTDTFADSPEAALQVALAQLEMGSPSVEVFEAGMKDAVLEYDDIVSIPGNPSP